MEQRRVRGVRGWHKHLTAMLGRHEVLDYSWYDLMRLGETLQRYAMGRALVDLEESVERLEKAGHRRGKENGKARRVEAV